MLVYDKIAVDTSSYTVTYNGKIVKLHPKEYLILQLFLQFPSQVLSHDKIINSIWKVGKVPTHSSIRSHIRGLRKAFRKVNPHEQIIETVHGVGYRLKSIPPQLASNNQTTGMVSRKEPFQPQRDRREYLIVNENLVIQHLSPGMFKYCDNIFELEVGKKIGYAFPELLGLEHVFLKIINGEVSSFEIKGIKSIVQFSQQKLVNVFVTMQNLSNFKHREQRKLLVIWNCEDI